MTTAGGILQRVLTVWDRQVEALPELEAELKRSQGEDAGMDMGKVAAAARRDLEDLHRARFEPGALTHATAQRLARRLGWTIQALRTWDPHVDRQGHRLQAALISAAFWDIDDDLWARLEPLLPKRDFLCGGLEGVIRSRAPQVQVPANTPVWEQEHFRALQEAERTANWVRLLESARALIRLPVPDHAAFQAVRALWALDRRRLVALADNVETWMQASMVLAPLPLAAAFRLAADSTSKHIRFAAIERAVNRENRALSRDEENAVKHLFVVLARDEDTWPAWITLCNRFPVRHPYLQRPLGRALARSTEGAIRAYVDSIELTTPTAEGRVCVASCLAEFRRRATQSRRQALWRRAFQRWETWNFGAATGQALTAPGRSQLDYAVAGWLIEFTEPSYRTAQLTAFADQLKSLEAEWHSSISSLITKFNRLLSRYQLFAFASSCAPDTSNWLLEQEVFTPPAAMSAFVRARYALTDLKQSASTLKRVE